MERNLKIYAALFEESKEGWVWIPPIGDNIKSEFIKIIELRKRRYIVCEKRILDKNYIKVYNNKSTTKRIDENKIEESIVINAFYRNKLGIDNTQEIVKLKIVEANGCIDKYISAPLHHPNSFVRMGIILGIISMILGVIGLLLGLISIMISILF